MTLDDVEPAVAFMGAGGWGDKGPLLRFALAHRRCRPIVAVVGGQVVGTANATAHGTTGWIGEVFVASEARRSGAGTALFDACVKDLQERGCASLLLLATEMGRPIYERSGFRVGALVEQWRGPVGGAVPTHPTLRRAGVEDVPAIVALDAHVSGEHRRHLIEAFRTDASVVTEGDTLAGYYLPTPWREGALVAVHAGAAELLLRAHRAPRDGDALVDVTIPARNTTARDHLTALGFGKAFEMVRMTKGPEVAWRLEMSWGAFGLGFG